MRKAQLGSEPENPRRFPNVSCISWTLSSNIHQQPSRATPKHPDPNPNRVWAVPVPVWAAPIIFFRFHSPPRPRQQRQTLTLVRRRRRDPGPSAAPLDLNHDP
jgi:hypothetical protein